MLRFALLSLIPLLVLGLLIAGEVGYSPAKQRAFPESYDVTKKLRQARERLKERMAEAEPRDTEGTPKVVVSTTEHDFGVLPPQTDGEVQFEVRNAGDADLQLLDAGKTCLCVGFHVDRRRVPPGESALVTLQWNTKLPSNEYRHGASLSTNDPEVPLLKFRVNGRVKTTLGANPAEVEFTKIWPGHPESRDTLVVSEVWESFELESIHLSDERFTYTLSEVSREELPVHALSGYRLNLQAPTDLPGGRFDLLLTARGRSTDAATQGEVQTFELPIRGYVAKPLTVIGPELSSTGCLDFSVIPWNESRSSKLTLRVNDAETQLELIAKQVQPEFVQVELEPFRADKGLYFLTVTIPPHSPAGAYTAEQTGKLRLEFSHPRIDDLELDLQFVVLPPTP